jgi:hypothetical protein
MMPGVFFIVLLINYPKFNKKEEKALERIRELMYECGGEESPVKKLKTLEGYLTANKEGLRPCSEWLMQVIPQNML